MRVADWQRDLLPRDVIAAANLPGWRQTLTTCICPPTGESALALESRSHPAWRRVKFDELLAQQMALRDAKALLAKEHAAPVIATGLLSTLLRQRLPFRLTAPQKRRWRRLCMTWHAGQPMTRLPAGDVGSGKTVVAALAALAAVEAGQQVAFMAPTELLAEQHFNKLRHWLAELPVTITWLHRQPCGG